MATLWATCGGSLSEPSFAPGSTQESEQELESDEEMSAGATGSGSAGGGHSNNPFPLSLAGSQEGLDVSASDFADLVASM